MGLAHGHQTDGEKPLNGRPAPERHIALLPPQHGRAHHTGEYQPALWRVTRIHRHGCLLQQEAPTRTRTLRRKYSRMGFWVNIRLIRYPDVLLMAAEAANEKGLTGEAAGYLEQVRAHARGTLADVLRR